MTQMVLKDSVSTIDFYGLKHTYDFSAETHLADGAFVFHCFPIRHALLTLDVH